ncbi:hypothetical protein [Paraburkholderia strydomiana]|jgi:hypothetical protein|uniref:hypothetical protein n=1 Tax=Paraburkholderia strydomiana TaxID=1245417 RepID=UPI0038B77E36
MAQEWLKSEREVLRRIVSDVQHLANTIHFALDSAFPYPEHAFGQDVLVGMNVERELVGLSPGKKPGDVDLLVIPVREVPLFTHAIAIEAKIVRPTIANPSRNANSMGREQALGLLNDGFPFVALVHISLPEPLPSEQYLRIPVMSNELDENGDFQHTGGYALVNPFPLASARRQEGRLKSLALPKEIAFKSVGFSLSADQNDFDGCNMGEMRRGSRNPHTSQELVVSLSQLVNQRRDMFRQIHWFR